MTRTAILVLGVSAAVLGGAWLASSALTSDVSVPPSPEAAPAEATAQAPRSPVATPLPSSQLVPIVAPVPMPSPSPSPVVEPLPAVSPQAGEPTSEFASEHSAEIDRAWELAFGLKSNPVRWRMAERIFSSCLAEVPTNQRCRQGLEETRSLIQSTRRLPNADPSTAPSDRLGPRRGLGHGSHSEE